MNSADAPRRVRDATNQQVRDQREAYGAVRPLHGCLNRFPSGAIDEAMTYGFYID